MKTIIISASRRTDIPAFYSKWFMNRIRQGYCTVFNPYNRRQVSRISLLPQDVEVIVFWTKDPRPLIAYLDELDKLGYRYYFQYTINAYPALFEPYVPSLEISMKTVAELSRKIGPDRIIWRYDPIILGDISGYADHQRNFARIAKELKGKTNRVIISFVDQYRKAVQHLKELSKHNISISSDYDCPEFGDFIKCLVDIAQQSGLDIFSCAEKIDLAPYGVVPGKCIDEIYINKAFNIEVSSKKDKNQRLECGCIESKDIGVYDTCLHGCKYCYAGSLKTGVKNRQKHILDSPSLIGHYI